MAAAPPRPASSAAAAPEGSQPFYGRAFAIVTTLFFMWGFLTCLNDILVPHLKAVFSLNYLEAALIQFSFFSAYFVMAIPSGKLIEKIGYQRSMVAGLATAGVGALLFYPAAALASYPLFLGALFVLATGITVLQTAANPYVTALGPPRTASSRLNLTQAFNSLATTLAPLFGGLLILGGTLLTADQIAALTPAAEAAYRAEQAAAVQVPYVGLAVALFVLAALIGMARLPRLLDVEEGEDAGTFGQALRVRHLALGVVGIFLYVGAEVSIGSFLINFMALPRVAGLAEGAAATFVAYYWGGAMVGRFLGSAVMQRVDAGRVLGVCALVAAGLSVLAALMPGGLAMWSALLVGLFNSVMFPSIFALAVTGLGPLTGKGSSLLVMAIVGGALVPLGMGALADGIGLQIAFLLPALCYLFIVYYGFHGSRPERAGVHEPYVNEALAAPALVPGAVAGPGTP